MMKSILFPALAAGMAVTAGAAVNSGFVLDEERMAHMEEARIIQSPIAGIENRYWFNYRADVHEAKKELSSDLVRASDTEDLRDAWDEYRVELVDGRGDYIKEMAERGYRYPTITVTE